MRHPSPRSHTERQVRKRPLLPPSPVDATTARELMECHWQTLPCALPLQGARWVISPLGLMPNHDPFAADEDDGGPATATIG